MANRPLFAYGTLQDADILSALLGRPVDAAALPAAEASDYRAVFFPGRVYPALVAAVGSIAPGRLIAGLSASELAVLDLFEGAEYRRAVITVRSGSVAVAAWSFLPVPFIDAAAAEWSLAEWTAKHKPAVLGAELDTALAMRARLGAR